MATFVLIHGAWQGPRTWDRLVPLLKEKNYEIVVPVLTGLGDDGSRLSSSVDLMTHVQDVTREFTQQDLHDAILVGHSYGGMVITGVADRMHERLRSLIYLDAFLPSDGQSTLDLLPADIQSLFRELARTQGDGWRLPATDGLLDIWGLTAGPTRDFVRERLSDFSLPCFEQKLQMTRGLGDLPGTFVNAVGYAGREIFGPFAEAARDRGWASYEVQTGHQCQIEDPETVASILISAVEQ